MMNSAAVIGRQLRQQAVAGGRTSGPLLQQIPFGKNKPRAPSHALLPPRPHSPIPQGSGHQMIGANFPAFIDHNQVEPTVITFPVQPPSDRMNVTSKLTTGGAINAVVAQREQRALANQLKKLDMQRTNPKLRCTLHCFCVAFKALSGGLVLLIVGTIMSVYGFMMEAEQRQKIKLNPTSVVQNKQTEEVNARIRNLTYAGPVLMGLGGIVIVAALILAFEVRDTLGVKEQKSNKRSGNILVEKKQQKPKNLIGTELKPSNENVPINQDTNKTDFKNSSADDDIENRPSSSQCKVDNENESNICTIENELRKLSTNKSIMRSKTPPDTLQLNKQLTSINKNELDRLKELNEFDKLDRIQNRSDQKHSRHKLSSSANHRKRTLDTSLPLNSSRKEMKLASKSDNFETDSDQLNQTNQMLTTEHAPVSERHLSMSFSLDSTNLTKTDQQVERIYFDGLRSPEDTELSDEPSELFSLNLSNLNNNSKKLATKTDARCSCTASPESDQGERTDKLMDKVVDEKLPKKSQIKSNKEKQSFTKSDLNYHFIEQQRMQQQLIAQQQLLLQQQQQLTNLLQEKFTPSHHSISSSAPSIKQPLSFEQKPISSSFDQAATVKFEKTKSLDKSLIKKPSSIKSLPINLATPLISSSSFDQTIPLNKSTSTSNEQQQRFVKKSRSIASIESDRIIEE